jgi:hypothetical protein
MASFPIDFPPYTAATERFVLNNRQSATESPFTFKKQVVQTASQWSLEWTWPRVSLPRAEAISAWGLSLNGMIGSFRYYPNQTIRSTVAGKSLAITGYAYNDTISVGGWSANSLSGLRKGQWFTIGDQLLKIIDANALADASGRVTLTFKPQLRKDYSAGTALEFVRPFGVFNMAASESISYTLDPDRKPDFGTIQAREVV